LFAFGVFPVTTTGVSEMRSVILWLLGVPISIIILLNIFHII
jgi:hypothetical protein